MPNSGRVVLSRMDEVVYGKPAAESVAELARRYQAERVFLMVSGTLNRETDEIDRLRRALGNHCVGTFDAMPAHTPRAAVIAAAEQAREAKADLIVTLGGGSITDGAKAVQLCLANDITSVEALDRIRFSLSLDDDLEPFYELAEKDGSFAPIAREQRGHHHVKFPSAFEAVDEEPTASSSAGSTIRSGHQWPISPVTSISAV